MARKLRLEHAGACYHVINRGNYRKDLFTAKGAAESFQRCLFEACTGFGWRLHAFVIMSNHFHLAVETPEPNLSDGMRWLQATWAMRFNRFRGESGRPFQGRYKALHVEPGHALAQVCHYIHLNPVRAKILPVEQLMSYEWSSLPLFMTRKAPAFLDPSTICGETEIADTAAGWRQYLDYLGVVAEEDEAKRKERYGRYSKGWVIGSPGFRSEIKDELKRQCAEVLKFGLLGGDREAHRQLRSELWEDRLKQAADWFRIDLAQLPLRYSAPEKVKLAAFMKTVTSVSNDWLAQRLKMGQPGSVSQYLRRFRLKKSDQNREFRKALSRVLP